jgi:hypothetical protein
MTKLDVCSLSVSSFRNVDDDELTAIVGGQSGTRVERAVIDGLDWGLSKITSDWDKKDCAGRYGYIGWGYGTATGTTATLLMASGSKANKVVGGIAGGALGLYGARLQSIYVDNCRAKGGG